MDDIDPRNLRAFLTLVSLELTGRKPPEQLPDRIQITSVATTHDFFRKPAENNHPIGLSHFLLAACSTADSSRAVYHENKYDILRTVHSGPSCGGGSRSPGLSKFHSSWATHPLGTNGLSRPLALSPFVCLRENTHSSESARRPHGFWDVTIC